MMTDDEARQQLEGLARKYLHDDPDLPNLIGIIKNKSRPGLPVRGVLESIRIHKTVEYSGPEKDLIEELIYLYG